MLRLVSCSAVPAACTGGSRNGVKRKLSLPAPTSGNQWKAHYLSSLDIHILPTHSLAELLGGGSVVPLPAVSGQSVTGQEQRQTQSRSSHRCCWLTRSLRMA